jgi:hypothetical protein
MTNIGMTMEKLYDINTQLIKFIVRIAPSLDDEDLDDLIVMCDQIDTDLEIMDSVARVDLLLKNMKESEK